MNTLKSLDVIFGWVLQVSWQAAVLAALVLAAQWIFRRKLSSAWRYGLWMLLVVRLVMPISPQSAFSIFNLSHSLTLRPAAHPSNLPPAQAAESAPLKEPSSVPLNLNEPLPPRPEVRPSLIHDEAARAPVPAVFKPETKPRIEWLHLASVVWLIGVCLFGLRLLWANTVFRVRLARHAPVCSERVTSLLHDCASALGVTQAVTVVETEAVQSPAVWGFSRKWLLLPEDIVERFTDDELRHVFMHEFAHLKRRDVEVNWAVTILQVVHWFNPALWFAFGRMRAERELATDALALAHARESEHVRYGETILKVLEGFARGAVQPGLVGIAESKARLKERLREIARRSTAKPWRWAAISLAAVITGVGLTDAQPSKNGSKLNPVKASSNATNSSHSGVASPPSARAGLRSFGIRVMDYDTGAPLAGVKVVYTLKYYGGDGGGPSETKALELDWQIGNMLMKGANAKQDGGATEFNGIPPADFSRKLGAVTGKDGRATVQFPALGLKFIGYEAERSNYLALHGEWHEQELSVLGNEYQIKLSRGVAIGGIITDKAGKPIADAEVEFNQPINMMLSGGQAPFFQHAEMWSASNGQRIATTDASGQWSARCIWPAIQWASLRIHHPDFADATCSTELTSAMEAEGKGVKVNFGDLKEHRVRLTLSKGAKLSGHVADAEGKAVSGIEVNWAELEVSPHAPDQLLGQRSVRTDASGKFTIEHAPTKHLFFWLQMPGYAPAVTECEPGSTSEIELRVTQGVPLEGEVLDAQRGTPVAGARLRFADFGIWRGIRWETVSDANGRFAWGHAPVERFQLELEKDGFIPQKKIVQIHPGESVTVRLNPVLHISGRVVDAGTKKPINEFLVDWLDRFDARDFDQGYRPATVPGSNGVYSLNLGRLYGETWGGGYAHSCLFRVRASGYAPFFSRVFSSQKNDVGVVSYDIELKPVPQISGTVVEPNGQPVAGAQVALNLAASRLLLSGKPLLSSTVADSFKVTDAEGRFRVNADPTAQGLVAVATAGYAEIKTNEFASNLTVKLQPWGRIEGTAWEYGNLVTNQGVWASSANATWPESLRIQFTTNSDVRGRFAFDFVPPGKFRVFRMIPTERGANSGPGKVVEVRPGTTTTLKLGGEGRPVVGRFKITNPYVAIDWPGNDSWVYMHSITPQPPKDLKTREDFEAWRQKPEIERAYDAARNYPVRVKADGSFRIDEVVPGKYEMQIQLLDPRDSDARAYSKYIAQTTKSLEVPEPEAGSKDNAPLDIGTFEISLKPDFRLGQTKAPEFEAVEADGGKFKLSDFHGKYVLLDFWATWCSPCIGELQYLKQVREKFKSRPDFVMVSLSLDKSLEDLRGFLKKNELPWTQGYLGDWSNTSVPGDYGVQGIPAVFLINPEGKVIESELEGSSMVARLQKYLK